MKRNCPIAVLSLLALVASASTASAAPVPTSWNKYERSPRPDGAPSECLDYRRGAQAAGSVKWYVFQVYNDCNRRVRAVCDIAYAPNCNYGQDVAGAAHVDGAIEPYGETSVFGHFVPAATGSVSGCFFARCTVADP